ncbi:hypothetical protein BC351_11005 [Paenibacillus ferrarius]|uniref:Uncharacterized protein n=1 Tax=Paenibacillus ferrarius TaxID=1469647 RepID=A0A1V4HAG3_9BACL|nr:hypothetical protein [Paenibacillus ferrarius]OPH47707.1 hypothetical protein BC351_11005 [Paenibacillus ferrarius]
MYNNNNSSYGASSFGNASQGNQGNQSSQGYQSANTQYQGNQNQYQGNNTQYQGYQKQYQPVGLVQSFYDQNSQIQSNQAYNQSTSQDAFHTANYRGNQPGHDAYLRSDSSTPAQHQTNYQSGYSSNSGINSQMNTYPSQYSYATTQQQSYIPTQYGSSMQSNQPYAQSNISTNAFHTANYRGNQPGHDAYLRSDSSSPSQQSYQSNYGAPQQNYQQQGFQSGAPTFNNSGIGQQYGYNSSN